MAKLPDPRASELSDRATCGRWSNLPPSAARAAIVVSALVLLGALASSAQMTVGTITAAGGQEFVQMALYRPGGKLFVMDPAGVRVLVYDAATLASGGEISLAAYAPDVPQTLALHEGSGTLYVAVSTGFATSDSTVVVIDADTLTITDAMVDVGWDAGLTVDEGRSRLYVTAQGTLQAVDIATGDPIGSLNLTALMPNGSMLFGDSHLNASTGELFFSNLHYDTFLLVDGVALTGEMISATGSRGWGGGTWNPVEHKLYITTVAWNGYFVYDADTESSTVVPCVNDGTLLFFSPATHRVYSGAEIDGYAVVIEGATNACQELLVGGGQANAAFLPDRRQVFFASPGTVSVFDEDSLLPAATIENCGAGAFGGVGTQVIADPAAQRVFVMATWTSPSPGSCIRVIDSPALSVADAAVAEGNSGTKTMTFSVTLDPPAPVTVTVEYATGNGSATAGDDYEAASGTLTFLAGDTTETFEVTIQGDASCEADELFLVTLSGATAGVTLADAQAAGSITDDDTPSAPASVLATATAPTSVTVTWTTTGAASYDVYRSASGMAWTQIAGPVAGLTHTDAAAAAGTAYLYAVTAAGASCGSPLSAPDLATTILFTDPAITPGVTKVKAAHVTQLRSAVAAVRTLAGLGAYSYSDGAIGSGMPIEAAHVAELRAALDEARSALGLGDLTYTVPLTPGSTSVLATHVDELRAGVR